jgi:hypothetical protein
MMLTPLLFASLMIATPQAQPADAARLGAPMIFSGRKRGYLATERAQQNQDIAEGRPVPVRCKAFAPSVFSGRVRKDGCVLEIVRPGMDTVAPAIFSGRSPKKGNVIVGPAAMTYAVVPQAQNRQTVTKDPVTGQSYITDPNTGQTYAAVPGQIEADNRPKRRAPSIFSGRRAPRQPSQ